MRTLLLGMGNPILSDDAVGVRLAADVARALGPRPELEVLAECSVGGLALLEVLAGYERVIVLDSIKTRGGTPGACYRFDAAALRETLHLTNVHDANFATVLELGRRLRVPLPADGQIHVFAVETADTATFSERMTPQLEAAYPACLCAAVAAVHELLA